MRYFKIDSVGVFVGEVELDPFDEIPRGTSVPPPSVTEGEFAVWNGAGWLVVDTYPVDHEAVQREIVNRTQARLDTFARTRGYDGILSACTYATSSVPKFAAEGQYCVDARDNTWATLYQILAEVQTGARPVPSGFADIEGDLPQLTWPT